MVLVLHSYDTVSRGISQSTCDRTFGANFAQIFAKTAKVKKKHKLGKKAKATVFPCNWLAATFAPSP